MKELSKKNPTYITLFSGGGVGCQSFTYNEFDCIATNEIVSKRLDVQKYNKKCKYEYRNNKNYYKIYNKTKNDSFFTGDVYNFYQGVCSNNSLEVLTQRRVSDIIQEFDMLGIINVNVISKGRGGRMREIKLAISENIIQKAKKIIQDTLNYN